MKFPKKKSSWFFILLAVLILLSPLILYGIWLLKPAIPLDIILIDKTVSDPEKNEHASFIWLINNLKIVRRTNEQLYTLDDYYGFFPYENKRFRILDFERSDTTSLTAFSKHNQVLYITDTYGVYSNEWYKQKQISERSNLIYGGLTETELQLAEKMKEQKKLILAEFNCIGSPTKTSVRKDFEDLFHIRWTGWTGRYFDNLSPENADIPRWLINNYKQQHQNNWPFKRSGLAFVNENDQIEILEEKKDLVTVVPVIYTKQAQRKEFHLPEKIAYPYWFDILQTEPLNDAVSLYHINTTARGDSILNKNGILKTFPAVIQYKGDDYTFYYFAGDFADNHISKKLSHYSGIAFMKSMLSSFQKDDREGFYWDYYYPLMSKILTDHYKNSKGNH